MARPLLPVPMQGLSSFSVVSIAAILSVISVVVFLCGSKKMIKSFTQKNIVSASESSKRRMLYKLNSSITEKTHLMVKMISWKKMDEGDDSNYDDDSEEAVWRKTIIMGERCRPLDFSGKIEYDSEGHVVAGASTSQTDQNNKIVPLKR